MTDILDRIDQTVTDWEAQPESWLPGDPLYPDPRTVWADDRQVIRPMFEVFEEDRDGYQWLAWCGRCEIGWSDDAPYDAPCWICGLPPTIPAHRYGRRDGCSPIPVLLTHAAPILPTLAAAMRAAAEFDETMRRFLTFMRPEPLPPSPPLHVDRADYHHRTRNRRGRRR